MMQVNRFKDSDYKFLFKKFNFIEGDILEKEADLIMQITTSWHEKGKIEGKIEKAQEDICKFMARRFNADPSEVRQKIQQLASLTPFVN